MSSIPSDKSCSEGSPSILRGYAGVGDPSFVAMLLRMRILIGCAGQSGPAAPDILGEHSASRAECQENNIIN